MTSQTLDAIKRTGQMEADDLRLLQTIAELDQIAAPEPEAEKVISRGEAPMVMTPTKSAGYITLRRNSDGKLVSINRNQLNERLKQRLDDGRPAWLSPKDTWIPKGVTKSLMLKCLLHYAHPDRARMDALGLPVCSTNKQNIPDQATLTRHMAKKHKDSWAAIQQDITRQREDKRDATQERMAEALTASLTGNRTVAAPKAQVAPTAIPESVSHECEVCHIVVTAAGKLGLASKVKAHMKQHPAPVAA